MGLIFMRVSAVSALVMGGWELTVVGLKDRPIRIGVGHWFVDLVRGLNGS